MGKTPPNEGNSIRVQPFQVKLIVLVLLRFFKSAKGFKLIVHPDIGNNFIISLKCTEGKKTRTKNYFVCSKVDGQKTTIDFNDFMQEGDFSIVQLFESYNTIIDATHRGKLKQFKSIDNQFIMYTNAKCEEDLQIKLEDEIIVATHGYEFKLNDENKSSIHKLLDDFSPCKQLATFLAESIFKDKGTTLEMRNRLLQKYKGTLFKFVQQTNDKRYGEFNNNFINNEDLSATESKLRKHLCDEIARIKNLNKDCEINELLKTKNIKLPNNFEAQSFKAPKAELDDQLHYDEAMHNTKKINIFLNQFRILIDQMGETNLESMILKEIQDTYSFDEESSNIVYSEISKEIENWWKHSGIKMEYLSHDNNYFINPFNRLNQMKDYRNALSKYNVRFNVRTLAYYVAKLKNRKERVVDVECNQTFLHAILWNEGIRNLSDLIYENKYIIIQMTDLIKIQNAILNAFRKYITFLVVVVEGNESGMEILEEIRTIAVNENKKCIIIKKCEISQCPIKFECFDKSTQCSLMEKLINFQGVQLPFGKLVITELMDESDIVALICNENLSIGSTKQSKLCSFFIERGLTNDITIKSFDDLPGRVIGLHGQKGCGKTELLSYLIQQEHSKNKIAWVSSVNLTSSDILSSNLDAKEVVNFLIQKLQLNALSEKVFRQRIEGQGNIILIFEIIEIVDWNCNLRLNHFLQLLKSTKIDKIVLSFLTLENTEELDHIYNLRGFNYQEQCTLIENLWQSTSGSQTVGKYIEPFLQYFASNKPQINLTLNNPGNLKILTEIYRKVVQEMIYKNPKDYNFSVYKGLNNFYEYSIGQQRLIPESKYELLQAINSNNHNEIKKLIGSELNLVNASYDEPFNKQLLAIACDDFAKVVNLDTIKLLLRLGADLHHREERQQNRNILQFATLGQNKVLLDFLIESVKNNEILHESALLNLIIDEGNPLDDDYLPCVQTLLQYCDVKQCNGRKITPLENAAKKQYIKVVNLILEYYTNRQINYCMSEFEAIRRIGVSIEDRNIRVCTDNQHVNKFLENLDVSKEKVFVDWIEMCIKKGHDDDIEPTFLKTACEKNLFDTVDALLKSKQYCEWNFNDDDNHPIMIAAKEGYYEIFQCLIENEDTTMNAELLPKLLKTLEKCYNESGNDAKYFILLVKNLHKKCDANLKVNNGYHLLHYAVKYCGSKTVLELLKSNASLANENSNNTLTIQDLDADTLREHFDSCIYTPEEYHRKKNKDELPNDDKVIDVDKSYNTVIVFDYSSLYPKNVEQETDGVRNGNYTTNESKVLHHISQHSELHPLLEHPLINSFLELKWKQVKWIFFTNLIFYSIFCASLVCYSLPYYYLYTELDQNLNDVIKASFYVMLAFLILRELFQIYISQIEYCYNFENYLEWTLIIIATAMSCTETSSVIVKQQLCAVGLLLAAFDLLFLIGNFDSCVIYVVMFRKVSINFFKCFFVYIILFITFTISFRTLFTNNFTIESEPYITNIFYGFLKTIIMLTGSIEADKTLFEHYPYVNFFVFTLFVFLMTIILFNLMNGLAVSDTGEIQNNAQQIRLAARVDFIRYAEKIARILNKRKWITRKLNKQKREKIIADKFGLYSKLLNNYTANSKDPNFNENIIKSAMHIILERNRKLKHEFDRKQKDLEIYEIRIMLKEILSCLNNNK